MHLRPQNFIHIVTVVIILLIFMLCLVLGVMKYRSEYRSELANNIESARAVSQPIFNLLSGAIDVGDYSRAMDIEALHLYKANNKLRFFEVSGCVKQDGRPFSMIFYAGYGAGKVVRTTYPEDYEKSLQKNLKDATRLLEYLSTDNVNRDSLVDFVNKLNSKFEAYRVSHGRAARLKKTFFRPSPDRFSNGYYLDEESWRLHLLLPIDDAGGDLWMVFNAEEIGQLGSRVLLNMWPINIGALLVCMFVVWSSSRMTAGSLRVM